MVHLVAIPPAALFRRPGSPHDPFSALLAYIALESGAHDLTPDRVSISPRTFADFRQMARDWAEGLGMQDRLDDLSRPGETAPVVGPAVPAGYALILPAVP